MKSAHGASLPLFGMLQMLEEEDPAISSVKLNEGLKHLDLDQDIEVYIHIADEFTAIGFDPLTDFGQAILEEIAARAETSPCPDGEHDFGRTSCCKWCGFLLPQ